MFRQCGAIIIDADELARQAVQPGKPAWKEIVRTFGKGILNPDRTINRHTLGTIVFRDKTKLRCLERIVHPRVAREQARLTKQAAREHPHAVVIYDVPLLFESGMNKRVHQAIVVTADRETQIARLKKRNGLTRAEAIRRIKSQMPLSKKVHLADIVIDGTLPRAVCRKKVRETFRILSKLASSASIPPPSQTGNSRWVRS
jgi:dephospho-CoA kinase